MNTARLQDQDPMKRVVPTTKKKFSKSSLLSPRRRSWSVWLALIVMAAFHVSGRCSFGKAPKPNIVFVVLDTLRFDFTGLGGNKNGYTPNLDRLAKAGTAYRHVWAPAPWTVPSHASMFTGLLPSVHGCDVRNFHLRPDYPTLAEILAASGYDTAAFFSNPWLSDRATGLLRGFSIKYETPVGGLDVMSVGRGDKGGPASNRAISEWLAKRAGDKPFFLFVNYLEPHLPFDPPAQYRATRLTDLHLDDVISIPWAHEFNAGLHPTESVNWDRVRRLYGGTAYTADLLLGDLVQLLKQHGLYRKSVLVVTSDHGENLGEHRLMDHQFSVHETVLAVPLVIHAGGLPPGDVREEPVMLTDLFATILDVAGIKKADPPSTSLSLLVLRDKKTKESKKLWDARPVIAEYPGGHFSLVEDLRRLNPNLDTAPFKAAYETVRRGDLRLTVSSNGPIWLHDLAADPGQTRNIAREKPEALQELLTILQKAVPGTLHLAPYTDEELDREIKEKLRSLGYIR